MSTYNGSEYVSEQIESILNQEHQNFTLTIRDDGSVDNTIKIIKDFLKKDSRIKLIQAKNTGIFKSFMSLLKEAGNYDYFAFSDQDDFWQPEKLSRGIQSIEQFNPGMPVIYYTRLEFTDSKLNHTGYSAIPTQSGFHTALVQNQATGCTVIMNASARQLVLESVPEWALMHDWWCYLVVSAFGEVVYDSKPTIRYRKHPSNVTPASPDFITELKNRVIRYFKEGNVEKRVTDQAIEFKKRYGHKLSSDNLNILDGFINARAKSLPGRLLYALNMPVRRNTPIDTLIMRLLIIGGRF